MATILDRLFKSRNNRAVAPSIPPRSNTIATPEVALTLSPVWRAVQIVATTASNLGIQTKRYAGSMDQIIENPVLVNKPSLTLKASAFYYSTYADLALYGNAYWVKSFDSRGQVNELTPISARDVQVEFVNDRINSPRQYTYAANVYSSEQIEHIELSPRAGFKKSPSPIETCSQDIVAALDLRNYFANWFSSSGIPTGILKTNKDLSPEDGAVVTANWHAKQANRQIAVLGNGFEFQTVQMKPSEALFTEVMNQVTQNIARLFGMPPRKLGTGVDGTSDTYSNLTDEETAYFRETLQAYTRPVQEALSACLPRGQRVEFLWEDLILSKSARLAMWKDAIDAGIITPQYAAMKEGLDG